MSIPATSSTISSAPILTNVGGGGAAGGGQGGGCMPQQKDTTMTKIFVGGLPYHTTDESLRMYFAVYGDIEEAVVITDRQTGKSRGYGFVTMANKDDAARACKDPNPIIDGRKANVNLAYIGAKPRIMQTTLPQTAIPMQFQMQGLAPATRLQYPGLIAAQPGAQAPGAAAQFQLQQAGLQMAHGWNQQFLYPQMMPLHQQGGHAAPNGSAANGAGQQMIDPGAQGYTFIDPSYALALHQMQQYSQTTAGAQQPSTAAQSGGTEQQRY